MFTCRSASYLAEAGAAQWSAGLFDHIFQGSSPGLLVVLRLGLVVHVGSGFVAILSGAGALALRKGGRLHSRFGNIFFVAMLLMAAAASTLAAAAVGRGHAGQMANVFAGAFAFYLVTTGWMTVRRGPGLTGRTEIAGCVAGLSIAALALFWLLPTTLSAAGRTQGVPVAAPIILATVAVLLAGLDLKVVVSPGLSGASRTKRHLWRMCLGLFVATGSFFIGQQEDMPPFLRGSPALLMLGLAPLAVMGFWLVRFRRSRPAAAVDPA